MAKKVKKKVRKGRIASTPTGRASRERQGEYNFEKQEKKLGVV